MAKKKNSKSIIIGACIAAAAIIVIILAVVFAAKGSELSDSYFVSDGSKYVITMDRNDLGLDESAELVTIHQVYTYLGDEITGAKAYYEYASEDLAKAAYDEINANEGNSFKSITLNGKYVILEADKSEYEELTLSSLKQLMEGEQNTDSEEGDTEEEAIEESEEELAPEEE